MTWFFVLPLVVAFVLIYFGKNCADDIANLAFAIIVASLILSLIFAPWQIQCVLLATTLLASSRLLHMSRKAIENADSQAHKLFYRGANCDLGPSEAEVTEGDTKGRYRGQIWHLHQPKKLLVTPQTASGIKYRGAKV